MKRIIFVCFFFLAVLLSGCGGRQDIPVTLGKLSSWKVISDSGHQGGSQGVIEEKDGIQLTYSLGATKLWPWPEIDFYLEYENPRNIEGYQGIELVAKSDIPQEIYCYVVTEDKNTGLSKRYQTKFMITPGYQSFCLVFSDFKIAKDWAPRHPGYSPSIEWDRVKGIGFHKKGYDQEKGTMYVQNMKFLKKVTGRVSLEDIRSKPPRHIFTQIASHMQPRGAPSIEIHLPPVSSAGPMIHPYLYGVNWGVWLDLPDKKEVIPLNLKMIRAGGPFMDRYDWRENTYSFPGSDQTQLMTGLDEFIRYCRSLGAEPLIQINALGYFTTGTNGDTVFKENSLSDVASFIRYLNQEKKYNVRFFEIGNEPFIWHNVHYDVVDKPYAVEEYFNTFKKIAYMIKKVQQEIDPSLDIKIFAPGISTSHQDWKTFSGDDQNENAALSFIKKCRDYEQNSTENPEGVRILDVFSFHFFADFGDIKKVPLKELLCSTRNWWDQEYPNKYDLSLPYDEVNAIVPAFRTWIEEIDPQLELAITEFNVEADSMIPYPYILKVLYLADCYGIFATHGVDYALQFCLNSSDQYAALIDDTDQKTPLYYPFYLFSRYFHGRILKVTTSLSGAFNIYACQNDSDIIMMVINKNGKELTGEITVAGQEISERARTFLYTFPALSLTCLRIPFDAHEDLVESWEYGQAQIYEPVDFIVTHE
ncbi:MAG: hypothetical protein JXD21_00545 [Candidatus Omnitrophica bacterium]|nr:hypothetical protein [Candidatus Omnitrophota bacterium]